MQDDRERRTRRRRLSHRFAHRFSTGEGTALDSCLSPPRSLVSSRRVSAVATTWAFRSFLAQARPPLASGVRFPCACLSKRTLLCCCYSSSVSASVPFPLDARPPALSQCAPLGRTLCVQKLVSGSMFSPLFFFLLTSADAGARAQGSRRTRSGRRPRARTRPLTRSHASASRERATSSTRSGSCTGT
jgi:hypothetical protein